MRPFGCPVTILNSLDPLGKFKGKVDERFLVGYSVSSKAFRVFNSRIRIVQETLHVNFLENKPNLAGSCPTWLFDIDSLTRTMNYQPVIAGNQTNPSACFQDKIDAEKAGEKIDQQYVLFPMWSSGSTNLQNNDEDAAFDGKEHNFHVKKPESEVILTLSSRYRDLNAEFEDCYDNRSNKNWRTLPTLMMRMLLEEPKRVHQALKDPSLIEAMQEELLQFKMLKVWVLVDLPHGKRAIDDYCRFPWVFFLATKNETSPILKTFITGLENQLSLKVKVIRSDNRTEFKNNELNQFCGIMGIKREFSVPRTLSKNGIAERKHKTLIKAVRTMLADSLLPIPF
nr:putative ribonuclease H-like domain-containing protein [Tanacetum cinerariifolium]